MNQTNAGILTEKDVRYTVAPILLYMLGFADTGFFKDSLKRILPPVGSECTLLKGRNDVIYDQRVRNLVSHSNSDVRKQSFYTITKGPKGTRIPAEFCLVDIEGSKCKRALLDNKRDEWSHYVLDKSNCDSLILPSDSSVNFLKRFVFAGMPDVDVDVDGPKIITCYDDDFAKRIFSTFGFHLLGWNQQGDPTAYVIKTEEEYCYNKYTDNELTFIKSRLVPGLCYICVIREDETTGLITGLELIDAVDK